MKNVFVILLLAFGFLVKTQTINAQSTQSDVVTKVVSQEKYIEVTLEDLPKLVVEAVAKDYTKATINKAFAKENNSEFKLQVTKEDGVTVELYCDADGKWITKK